MSDWSVDPDVRRFGSRSMRCLVTSPPGVRTAYPIENDAGGDVAVTPDTGYILTCYVNTGPLPVNADIALKVFAEGSTVDELVDTYIDTSESITRNTTGKGDENWQRLILRFATTEQTRVRPMIHYGSAGTPTVGDTFWIDAVQMEESPIPTPWRPGMVGNAAVLDLQGLMIDGQQGGLLRLRDTAGRTSDLGKVVVASNFYGARVFKSSTLTCLVSSWERISNFTDTYNLGNAEWNGAGFPGGVWLKEPGVYVVNLFARFVNPAVIGKRIGLGVWHSYVPASFVSGTAPSIPRSYIIGVAEANNMYISQTIFEFVPAQGVYLFPLYWQSVGAAQTLDNVMFTAVRVAEYLPLP